MPGLKSFILTYHSLDHSGSIVSMPPRLFREQMELLHRSELRIVPLNEIRERPGSVALTFDDGYRNFHEFALPVLLEFDFPATVFVAAGYIGREACWEGQIPALAASRTMSRIELREISEYGVALGAHAVNHRDLTKLSDEEVIAEMEASRDALAEYGGGPPKWFAYPLGACDERVCALASCRFELACSTKLDFVRGDADAFDLPRLDSYYFRDIAKFYALISGSANIYVAWRRGLRQCRARLSR